MPDLVEREAYKYAEAYLDPAYRAKCHGLKAWADYRTLLPQTIVSAVDFGSGTGRLVKSWSDDGIDAYGVDFVAPISTDPAIYDELFSRFIVRSLNEPLPFGRMDFGMCADVMEHIPEDQIDAVLENMAAHARCIFFQIANFRSVFKGHDLHPTQRKADWWKQRIRAAIGGTLTVLERRGDLRGEKHIFLWKGTDA